MQAWTYIHAESHEGKYVQDCPLCICKAVRAIEKHTPNEAIARIFLEYIGTAIKLEALAEMRAILGAQDSESWMWKSEYLR